MNLRTQKTALLITVCIVATWHSSDSYAQVHISEATYNKYPALSDEQHRQGHYASAAQSGRTTIDAQRQKTAMANSTDVEKAKYNIAVSKLKTDAADAATYATQAISDATNPALSQRIAYSLAQYYFRKDKFADAIKYYEQAGIVNLDNEEVSDQKFELAYCYFNNKQFDKARPLFSYIKDIKESKYYIASNYYFGLLCYNENKYDLALKSFEIVKEEKEYMDYVPYYIAEIYYFKGNRSRALSLTDTLISRKQKSFYHTELHLLAAQCLFEEKEFARARPYFEYYYTHIAKIGKEDLYKMSYCYYRLGEWKNATEKFKMLSNTRDSLGQSSMYLLGDCYLKTGNKQSARSAFGMCADMPYNKSHQEAAMILYSRLSYETGNNDDALRQASTLIGTFPNSKYVDEAKTITSDLLIKTNRYDEALKYLEGVQVKDNKFKEVYQKTTYGYAVQQFGKSEFKTADEYFAKSLSYPANPEFERAGYFWRSEIAYHEKRYADAINYAQNFVSRIGDITIVEKISPQATVQHAYLNMGYSAMETGNYVAAQDYFSQAQRARSSDKHAASTATILEADAVFLQKDFGRALNLYEKIIASKNADADYATYQKAILLGLQGKPAEKLSLLQKIHATNPPSAYANNARYEIALTHLEMENYRQALAPLKYLSDSATDRTFAPKALMKAGFTYQQIGENSNAITAYKRVVADYPAADDRPAALETLKNLFIITNQPGMYATLLMDNNLPSADSTSLDSTYYSAAESQYAGGMWANARQGFSDYLAHYPNGIFAIKAHYYLAESNFKTKRLPEAKEQYNVVLGLPWSDFSESSARRAAAISMELKDYQNAYVYYSMLRNNTGDGIPDESIYRGLMKSAFHTGKVAEAGLYADTLLASTAVLADAVAEAKFYKARTLQQVDNYEEASELYKQLAGNKNGEIAAESRYRIAEMLEKQDKLKEAEEAASESFRLSAGYDTWVGKSYLLLADILIKQKDYFNAKALLQSIVKNTKIAELRVEAARKLDEVKKLEKKTSKLSEE